MGVAGADRLGAAELWSAELLDVVSRCEAALGALADRDWSTPASGSAWTVRETVDHLVDVMGFYTLHLVTQHPGPLPVDVRAHDGVSSRVLLRTLFAQARGLARLSERLPSSVHAWHFHGTADVSGFLAMACAELLIHTDDACRGLGRALEPGSRTARAVLQRLFPAAPLDDDPWRTLRWATGRASLPGRRDVDDGWRYDPG